MYFHVDTRLQDDQYHVVITVRRKGGDTVHSYHMDAEGERDKAQIRLVSILFLDAVYRDEGFDKLALKRQYESIRKRVDGKPCTPDRMTFDIRLRTQSNESDRIPPSRFVEVTVQRVDGDFHIDVTFDRGIPLTAVRHADSYRTQDGRPLDMTGPKGIGIAALRALDQAYAMGGYDMPDDAWKHCIRQTCDADNGVFFFDL